MLHMLFESLELVSAHAFWLAPFLRLEPRFREVHVTHVIAGRITSQGIW